MALTLEPGTNAVAYGTVVSTSVDNQLLHGVSIPTNCVHMAIDYAIDGSAQLQFQLLVSASVLPKQLELTWHGLYT